MLKSYDELGVDEAELSRCPRILWWWPMSRPAPESYAAAMAAATSGAPLDACTPQELIDALTEACRTNRADAVRAIGAHLARDDLISAEDRRVCVGAALTAATAKQVPTQRAGAVRALLDTTPLDLFTDADLLHALLDTCSGGHVETLRVLHAHGISSRLVPGDEWSASARLPSPCPPALTTLLAQVFAL